MTREELRENLRRLIVLHITSSGYTVDELADTAIALVLKEAAEACIQNVSVWQQVIAWNRSKSERRIEIAFEAHVAEEIGKFYAAAILALGEK